jgi:hypothetical protein
MVPMSGARAAMQAAATGHKPVEKKIWGWLGRCAFKRPHLTKAVVGSLSVICTWLGILALLAYVTLGVGALLTDSHGDHGDSKALLLVGFFVLFLPGMLLFKFGSRLKAQGRLLKAAGRLGQAPAEP